MVDILADLVPLYGVILIIAIWCFGSYLISKRYSKDLKSLELHDKMKIKLGKELNIPKEEVLEMWFDRSLRDAKGVYVIHNKMFSDYIFIVKYTTKEDSYEVETFIKAQREVEDF